MSPYVTDEADENRLSEWRLVDDEPEKGLGKEGETAKQPPEPKKESQPVRRPGAQYYDSDDQNKENEGL